MEPSLAVAFSGLKSDVGRYLGFGRGVDFNNVEWSADQLADINRCVQGGLRSFYDCGYSWSFLKPILTLVLASGENTVALPDDISGPEGDAVIVASSIMPWVKMQFRSIGEVLASENSLPDNTGPPQVLCIEPLKGTTSIEGQRFQVHAYPTADQDYTLKFQAYINPNYLSETSKYALGGAEHSQTLLEACLAEAESLMDNTLGVHTQKFKERLEISKELDRRKKPQKQGICTDGDKEGFLMGRHDTVSNPVSFYGISTADW